MRHIIISLLLILSSVSFAFEPAEILGNWSYTGLTCRSGAEPKKEFRPVMSLHFEATTALYVSSFPDQSPHCTFIMGPMSYSVSGSNLRWQSKEPQFINICEDGRSKYGTNAMEASWGLDIQGDLMKVDMREFTYDGEYCESGDWVYFNFKRNPLPVKY